MSDADPARAAPEEEEEEDLDGSRAPLLDHLIELRRRLLWSFATFLAAFFVCFYFAEPIFAFLVQPLLRAGQERVIYTALFEAFFVQVKVGFFAALMVSFPIIANQLWRFVAPGLYAKEKKALRPFLVLTPFLFIGGAALAYYVAMPVALDFLLSYQGQVGGVTQDALPAVGNYLDFVTHFLFGFGLAFLLPVLLMLLERAGLVTRHQLKRGRRYAIVVAFVIAAVLTPPDVISQFMLAVPLILLYEISLFAIWFTERRRAREAASQAPSA